ncbi:MAG TPA: TIGR03619 family F420-dependent LLM class oxidoreductase [Nitrososphaeraceae archaeon]|nr:TIGR03619 family F420-dependent LLM class oxidoreductase [Nitrososphaeraceae archaeon]
MKIGLVLPQAGEQATTENIIHMAKTAEQEDFDSLWVFERLLWPLKPQTPYPGTLDGSLPIEYQSIFDPIETLCFVAANTSKIALGTSVIDMLFHNPVILARRFATLDIFSGGRAVCGLGIGWSKDEYQAANIPFSSKGKRADEFIQVLRKIWSEDVVEFKGQYYNIPKSKIGPKPIQKPNIPIYLGGFSPNTFARIVGYDTNGWLGLIGGPLDYLENTIKALKDEANKANKDQNSFKTILLTYPNLTKSSSQSDTSNVSSPTKTQRFPLTGTIDEIAVDLKRIKGIGVEHIIFGYNFIPTGKDVNKMIDTAKQLSRFVR